MDSLSVHQGFLRKYGGFLFKHWKERYLHLTHDGSLLVSREPGSSPDLVVPVLSQCQVILEGSKILDLPKLPVGAQADSCLGLSLSDGRTLLLLAPDSQECNKWIDILRKVKESLLQPPLSPGSCKRHPSSPIRKCCWKHKERNQAKDDGRTAICKEKCPPHCLRHGSQLHRGVKTACILMGGAAAGPTLGHMVTSSHGSHYADSAAPSDFRELGYHASVDTEGCQYNMDFEGMDQDYNTFDFGGFAF
ncbi:uncharacterized protein LOC121397063 [Xenopus laevis]|uniref:PH domain-containing protein n=2 Tax=Xenopus laevis TaxID=8355 RepID=A0A974C8P3_XENLA|nr:uncharacterized protein LOC121397063 [Xenopus laevis]OCT68040.1 hypothetical protein XELAEV_18039337mg [Xenopus laevis]